MQTEAGYALLNDVKASQNSSYTSEGHSEGLRNLSDVFETHYKACRGREERLR